MFTPTKFLTSFKVSVPILALLILLAALICTVSAKDSTYSKTEQYDCPTYGCSNTVTFTCSGAECNPTSDATLTISLKGDYDHQKEFAVIRVDSPEGELIGVAGKFGPDSLCGPGDPLGGEDHCKSYGSKAFWIPRSKIASYLADGSFTVWIGDGTAWVNYCCNASHRARLEFTYRGTADITPADAAPPVISNPQPAGTISNNILTISVDTDESAICRFDSSDRAYDTMTNTFSTTGALRHASTIGPLGEGDYTYHVRCKDGAGNRNTASSLIEFEIAPTPPEAPGYAALVEYEIPALLVPGGSSTVYGKVKGLGGGIDYMLSYSIATVPVPVLKDAYSGHLMANQQQSWNSKPATLPEQKSRVYVDAMHKENGDYILDTRFVRETVNQAYEGLIAYPYISEIVFPYQSPPGMPVSVDFTVHNYGKTGKFFAFLIDETTGEHLGTTDATVIDASEDQHVRFNFVAQPNHIMHVWTEWQYITAEGTVRGGDFCYYQFRIREGVTVETATGKLMMGTADTTPREEGTYARTEQKDCSTYGCSNTATFTCSGADCNPTSDAVLTISLKGDYDHQKEFAVIRVDSPEGELIGVAGQFGADSSCGPGDPLGGEDHCKSYSSKTFTIPRSKIASYLADGSFTVWIGDGAWVNYCCNASHKAQLEFHY
jgi:hypothetical protein